MAPPGWSPPGYVGTNAAAGLGSLHSFLLCLRSQCRNSSIRRIDNERGPPGRDDRSPLVPELVVRNHLAAVVLRRPSGYDQHGHDPRSEVAPLQTPSLRRLLIPSSLPDPSPVPW